MRTLFALAFATALFISCKKDSASQAEAWPKVGYLFTKNFDGDSVWVEPANITVTSNYSASFPLTDIGDKWTIARPSSGEGVVIKNDANRFWSIDSAFHPGLMVEQHFITSRVKVNPDEISDFNRFKFHNGINGTFYLESVRFPGFYVTGLPHAESGRGLRLRSQSEGSWDFWMAGQ